MSQVWTTPHRATPVEAVVALPGSKSLTARALVLAALADGPSRLVRPLRARDTDLMAAGLRALGVAVDDGGRGRAPFTVHGTGRVRGGAVSVDATESSQIVSGLLLAAARFDEGVDLALAGGVPSMPHVEMTVTMLRAHGVDVTSTDRGWRVSPGDIAALCALADGPSRLTGIGHLRGHETDRLQALDEVLTAVGATVEQLPDGLVVRPGTGRPARVGSYADHRMVHAAAVLGLAVVGVEVEDPGAVSKTLPDFAARWTAMLDQPVGVDR